MKRWLWVVLVAVFLSAALIWTVRTCRENAHSSEPPMSLIHWEKVRAWLNSSEPVTTEQLRGRVVLLFFWSYANSSALEALPMVTAWQKHYGNSGLEIIGVHTPEFSFDQSSERVAEAVKRLGITFPVAVDSDRAIWKVFANHEWPAYYVINKQGQVIGFQIGAGHEVEVEGYLRDLLKTERFGVPDTTAISSSVSSLSRTPEILFGDIPVERLMSDIEPVMDEPRAYRMPEKLPLNAIGLSGVWQFEEERVRSWDPRAQLVVHYLSSQCFLVMGGPAGTVVQVRLDGKPVPVELAGVDLKERADGSSVVVGEPRLFELVQAGGKIEEHALEITCPKGVTIYACTFN